MTIHLRQYQQDALAAEARHRAEHPNETRLAIVLPTGSGKGTILAKRAIDFIEDPMGVGQRVLIMTHTIELVDDLTARCKLFARQSEFPITVGTVKADQDEVGADVVVASPQTLLQPGRRERITDVGLVIVDECELYAAPQWQEILRFYGCFAEQCEHVGVGTALDSMGGHCTDCMDTGLQYGGMQATPALGFTATLERGDRQGLGNLWQDVVYSRDIPWGVRKGFLVQPIGYRLEIDLDGGEMVGATHFVTGEDTRSVTRFTGGSERALDLQLIEALAPTKIVEKWLEVAEGRQTIAFMPLVRSARVLSNAFHAAGVDATVIWGEMPKWQREQALAAYECGDVTVLVNAMVLTRGFDSPKTTAVIIGRPTRNVPLGIQMAGRGLRPVPGIPVEEQDCVLIYVQDATSDLFCHADLSDKPLDRRAEGALTAMEDAWDIGRALDEQEQAKFWTGQVDARQFDPLVRRSSKVWRTTRHGTPFLPISKDQEYVFVVGTSVFLYEDIYLMGRHHYKARRLHKDLPDLELAMAVAEEEAEDRGGGLGRLLADKNRPWRKAVPSDEMIAMAERLGLSAEVGKIMGARAGGKAGKVSDLISRELATRTLEPMVERIKEATR